MADPLPAILDELRAIRRLLEADRDTKPANDDDGEVTEVKPRSNPKGAADIQRALKRAGLG